MAFRKVTGVVKYYNLKETEPGTLLVDGFYVGEGVSERYGTPEFYFRSLEKEDVHLAGGHLRYLIQDNLKLKVGTRCKVYYEGSEKLPSNHNFKGSLSHKFSMEVDDEDSVYIPRASSPVVDDESTAPWDKPAVGVVFSPAPTDDDENEMRV